ncbi:DUF2499 domain-containing protein [Gloeobacter morelensis]|uniref:DUF2499 domain-containing protein n=1 Tax=Gloeobacter morelensis MG652769 TaxID=2781736 RepID=A0ABY3PMN7_9CYAN|nr:DUF2499 domain-containing protein [Gloeobacter morelensis]UFP94848.1 DUF2499 domain-containing protein [Gloeobacter morelensis MG652769]
MQALSLPTWIIHIASVVEWTLAIALIWRYGERTGERSFRALCWGMLPALVGAMAVLVWHYFDNRPDLAYLGQLQAAMTLLGNTTLAFAAYLIYRSARRGPQKAP